MNKQFDLMLTEEDAVAEVQGMALRLLRDKEMSQKDLAEAMNVSQSYISQILGDEPKNLTIRKAANLFFHLGEPLLLKCDRIDEMDREALRAKAVKRARHDSFLSVGRWTACNANDRYTTAQEPVAA